MIRVLDEQVIRRIAAGEVVERPASVVKELVENAIDAGARNISVVLEEGGRSLIRVEDDGCGMSRADATVCTERHATSKIQSDDDLFAIATLGFRGEALPSIASVSRFSLVTRCADDEIGTQVAIEGGLPTITDVGCPVGTRIEARDLFFGVPARRKFMRSEPTELGHAMESLQRQAALHPDLSFSFVHNGRRLLDLPRVSELRMRAVAILGDDARDLQAVDHSFQGVEVRGLASGTTRHRADATGAQYLYVNGRFVKDPLVRRAIAEAYRDLIPKGRHPILVLDIRLDPAKVDVNVHPAKTELRFADPAPVVHAITAALNRAVSPPPREPLGKRPLLAGSIWESATTGFPPPARDADVGRGSASERRSRPVATATHERPPAPIVYAHPDDDPGFQPRLGRAPVAADIETETHPTLALHNPRLPIVFLGRVGDHMLARDGETLWIIDPVRWWRRRWKASCQESSGVLGISRRLSHPILSELTPGTRDRLLKDDAIAAAITALGVRLVAIGPLTLGFTGLPNSVSASAVPDLVAAWERLHARAESSPIAWTDAVIDIAEPEVPLPSQIYADSLDDTVAWSITPEAIATHLARAERRR